MHIKRNENSVDYFVQVDTFCDKVPVLSSATNISELFLKAIDWLLKQAGYRDAGNTIVTRNFTHLNDKNIKENIILAIPGFGQVFVLYKYLTRPTRDSILESPLRLKDASNRLKNDKNFILQLVEKKPEVLKFASDELKNKKDFVLQAINLGGSLCDLDFLNWGDDKDIALAVIKKNHFESKYLGPQACSDREVMTLAIQYNLDLIFNISETLLEDQTFLMECVKNHFDFILSNLDSSKEVSPLLVNEIENFLKNKSFVLESLSIPENNHQRICQYFKDDSGVMLEAIATYAKKPVCFIPGSQLLANKEFMLQAIEKDPRVYACAHQSLQEDADVILHTIEQAQKHNQFRIILKLTRSLKEDKDFMLQAITKDKNNWFIGHEIYYFTDDKDFMLQAITLDETLFLEASERLRNDPLFVDEAIKQNGKVSDIIKPLTSKNP